MSASPSSVETDNSPSSLAGALAPVTALLASVSLLLAGNGLQNTLIPVRGGLEDFGALNIGILGSAYFGGFTIGCYYGASLIRRAGHIRTYLAMVSLASAVALVHAFLVEPIAWWLLRALTGFCFAVLFTVIESWINEKTDNANRGTVFSIYAMITLTVMTLGQMMLPLADPKEFALFALASVLVSLAALPVAFTSAVTPAPIPLVRLDFRRLVKNSPVGVIGCLAVGFTNGAFWGIAPVFAQDRGFDTTKIGLFMSAVVLGGAIAQYPLGLLSDRIDRRKVIVIASVIALASAISITIVSQNAFEQTLLLGAFFGAGSFPLYALVIAHANDHADQNDFVETSSGLLLVFGAGAAIGPILASSLRATHSGLTLFVFTSVVHALLICFAMWRMSQTERPAEEDRVDFSESFIATETVIPYEPETSEDDPIETSETDEVASKDNPA